MRFTRFVFTNFKGIRSADLDIARSSESPISVLVGLNESGKTTLLEAINNFSYRVDLRKTDPKEAVRTEDDYQSFIPIGHRSNFNGVTSIEATISVSEKDWGLIEEFLIREFSFVSVEPVSSFRVNHKLIFENSKHVRTSNEWGLSFRGKRKGQKKFHSLTDQDWLKAAFFTIKLLPQIVYFPSTVFDFPNKIYLEHGSDKKNKLGKNEFYYEVFSDILRSVDPSASLETHVLGRLNSKNENDKQNLEALLLKIEHSLTTTVLSVWESIFGQPLQGKRFRVYLKKDESNRAFLQIKLVDGSEIFDINERSSGFRWFFVFILLTRYRISRSDPVLFLFDEPAANLHPNAQSQLLKSFHDLSMHCQIIYSTHSHYLINPNWLSSTFVVKNNAIEDSNNPYDIGASATDITTTPYRSFVGAHPEQDFYYKPILDVLDFSPAPTDFPSCAVLVEGKTDYYLLTYLLRLTGQEKLFSFFPGGGAGSLDALISLLSGWGKSFVALLDADGEGNKQKERYSQKFESIVNGRLFTLEEVSPEFSGSAIESLLHSDDIDALRSQFFPRKRKLTKKELHRAIQEAIVTNFSIVLHAETKQKVASVVAFIQNKILLEQLLA